MAPLAQSTTAVVLSPTRQTGLLLLLGATLAWSTAGLFARGIDLDTPTVIFWRGLFGTAGLLVALFALRGSEGFRDFARLGRAGGLYAVCSGLGILFFIGSLKATTIAHVAIIYATVPFAAAGLGWLVLREVPSRVAMIASLIALIGAATMVGFSGDGSLLGDAMAVGMVLAMACMMVIARARPQMPALAAGTVSAIGVPLLCLPFATLHGVMGEQFAMLAGFGLLNSTLGFALFIYGSRYLRTVETGLISALETPMTPLWVWLVFGETPSDATLLGGSVVMIAVFSFILIESRRPIARP
jgi:drug/metabolite transporter (DMT)-like permease